MNKKLIILLIAITGVLLCSSPIMASDNSMVTYSFLDGIFGGNQLDVQHVIIEKEKYKHVDENGNELDKHNNYYLIFDVNDDSDSFGDYSAKITTYNKKNKEIQTLNYDINSPGEHRVELDNSKRIKNATITITDGDGNVVFENSTDSFKLTRDYVKDKPVVEKTTSSSSSSSSGQTYWASANSDKFHYPSCEWAQKISGRNKIVFHSRDEAISSGYSPCQVCGP